ncbi:threonine synthase [Desulfovibrio litoralis]|uniref:Threonine synthase n=1 Tax=Desulfovibrio litoralis DSM 11393 TaxID=1121455 RepID=A0A1M7RW01_9BACT|nr:threonine synthase [Desulfovibrio litoralis]SHN50547.1 L-threonine synthase [Desulfovibrio litoralis DSM 11393]
MNTFPKYRGRMQYNCLSCSATFPADELLYTCPQCGGVFLLEDLNQDTLKQDNAKAWQERFDQRAATKNTALRGIFRFYELMAPILEEQDIVYLGEGNTPIIEASPALQKEIGGRFAYKNDGQNPSASFKDRGMALAFSYLKAMVRKHGWSEVLTVCASTGDTSAAAALYASYVGGAIRSVVLLPHGKVTAQQLSQPLGSGATVLELPGVFDDCMKVVEYLAENYRVALLNSKNAWRILGQESYAYEVAQWYDWNLDNICVFVPIGNAGNITALMSGFLKLHKLGIIKKLPRLFGVQSSHADPVFRYYAEDKTKRQFKAVKTTPSVAQAAMIGNPVSFPRVQKLAERFIEIGGEASFNVIQVSEQEIMDAMLTANRNGHITCTQGGECFAGYKKALASGLVKPEELAVLDATAHALKFADFQNMYFTDNFPADYQVKAKSELCNKPSLLLEQKVKDELSEEAFTLAAAQAVVTKLGLNKK